MLLVQTFTGALPNVHKMIVIRHHMLQNSDYFKEIIFPSAPVIALCRDNNLQDIPVHKKHNRMFFNKPNKCNPRGKNYAFCPHLQKTLTFCNSEGKERVRNYYNINCKSVNVVYAIL